LSAGRRRGDVMVYRDLCILDGLEIGSIGTEEQTEIPSGSFVNATKTINAKDNNFASYALAA